jgi:hypothetical protein
MNPKKHAEPARRAILFGASNITLGLPWVVPAVEERLGAPVELIGAWGHGRSYGVPSSLLYRTLRGIVHSKVWQVLEELPPRPSYAMLTDLGNDLAFGHTPDEIMGWLTTVFERLAKLEVRTIVTGMPIDRLRDQSKFNFFFFRVLYFPQYALRQADILAKVEEITARLQVLVKQFGFTYTPVERHWYGYDPIHIQFSHMKEAWEKILRGWDDEGREAHKRMTNPRRAVELYSLRPERYDIFAEKFLTVQPCYHTRRGSSIAMY